MLLQAYKLLKDKHTHMSQKPHGKAKRKSKQYCIPSTNSVCKIEFASGDVVVKQKGAGGFRVWGGKAIGSFFT